VTRLRSDYYNTKEAADVLGVAPATFEERFAPHLHSFPHPLDGKQKLYRKADIQAIITQVNELFPDEDQGYGTARNAAKYIGVSFVTFLNSYASDLTAIMSPLHQRKKFYRKAGLDEIKRRRTSVRPLAHQHTH